MRQDIRLGLAGGLLVSLLSWSGNSTPHFISIFPNLVSLIALVAFFFGVVRVQRREMGRTDLETTIRRVLPVGVISGLVMAATIALHETGHFSRFAWPLFAFGVLAAFTSCVLLAILAAIASWTFSRRPSAASWRYFARYLRYSGE
jgi:hypothetical protein